MKLIVKSTELAKKALKTNRNFTVGQILSGTDSELEVIYHNCPEAFDIEGGSEPSKLPDRKKEVISNRSDKRFKKFGNYKHKSF